MNIGEVARSSTEMRDTLTTLAQPCNGDHRPDSPILKGLAQVPT